MIWWSIPAAATLGAWLWTRRSASSSATLRPRPEPGSPEDAEDLERFAGALRRPLPDRTG